MNICAKYFLSILFSFAFFVYLLVVTVQHVGVTSASEVHKYPTDIGKYVFNYTPDAFTACHCVSLSEMTLQMLRVWEKEGKKTYDVMWLYRNIWYTWENNKTTSLEYAVMCNSYCSVISEGGVQIVVTKLNILNSWAYMKVTQWQAKATYHPLLLVCKPCTIHLLQGSNY